MKKMTNEMKMLHDYICLEDVRARAKVIEYKEILQKNYRLFDRKVNTNKIEKEIQKLETMKYCRNCKLKDTCAMYQTRNDKRGK